MSEIKRESLEKKLKKQTRSKKCHQQKNDCWLKGQEGDGGGQWVGQCMGATEHIQKGGVCFCTEFHHEPELQV